MLVLVSDWQQKLKTETKKRKGINAERDAWWPAVCGGISEYLWKHLNLHNWDSNNLITNCCDFCRNFISRNVFVVSAFPASTGRTNRTFSASDEGLTWHSVHATNTAFIKLWDILRDRHSDSLDTVQYYFECCAEFRDCTKLLMLITALQSQVTVPGPSHRTCLLFFRAHINTGGSVNAVKKSAGRQSLTGSGYKDEEGCVCRRSFKPNAQIEFFRGKIVWNFWYRRRKDGVNFVIIL